MTGVSLTKGLAATVQVYLVPAGTLSTAAFVFTKLFVGVTVNVSPEQIAAVLSAISTVTAGSTITVSWKDAPMQPPLLGVTV